MDVADALVIALHPARHDMPTLWAALRALAPIAERYVEVHNRAKQVARGEVRVHDDSDGSRNDIATAEFILSEDNHAPAGVAVPED